MWEDQEESMDQPRSHVRSGPRRPWSRTSMRGGSALLAAVVAGGCYSYQPLEGPLPPPTQTIRVQLTGAGEDDLLERQGIQLDRFEGRVLSQSGDELTMEVRLPANRMASDTRFVVDTLPFTRPHIRTVDVKQFSTGRTVLGVGGMVAGLAGIYGIVQAVSSSTDDNGGDGGGGGVVLSVVPLVGKVLGWLR